MMIYSHLVLYILWLFFLILVGGVDFFTLIWCRAGSLLLVLLVLETNMASSPPEKKLYFSRVVQRESIEPADEGLLLITFYFAKQTRCWYDNPLDCTLVRRTSDYESGSFFYACRNSREWCTPIFTGFLSRLGVPLEEQQTILDKLFRLLQTASPQGRILVFTAEITMRLLGSFYDLDTISALTYETPCVRINITYWVPSEYRTETHRMRFVDYHGTATPIERLFFISSYQRLRRTVRFTPASSSAIESLQKVRLDSLEEATIRKNLLCSICRVEFAEAVLINWLFVCLALTVIMQIA